MLQVDDLLACYPRATPLSKGGQKVVFSCQHERYGNVVVKIGSYNTPQALERIEREVRVLRTISSPHFPRCHHFERASNQRFVIVEELLEGQPLAERLEDFGELAAAAALLRQLVVGLSLLWSNRIVHRDVKPQNLIVSPGDELKIIDLGIARMLDETSLTRTQAPWGPCTPAYAAPEQLTNNKRELDHRCDQFQAGIVFGQLLLSGKHPFSPVVVGTGGSEPENILAARWARVAITAADGGTRALPVLERLLGHQPYKRYRHASDIIAAVDELIEK